MRGCRGWRWGERYLPGRIRRRPIRSLLVILAVGSLCLNLILAHRHQGKAAEERKPVPLACRPPHLDLWEPSIHHHFREAPPLQCGDAKPWITFPDGRARLSPSVAAAHGGSLRCSGWPLVRRSDDKVDVGAPVRLDEGSPAPADYMRINCTAADGTRHRSYALAVRPLPTPTPTDRRLNIAMLALDSLSRLTFMRKLPLTYAFLRNRLGAAVLEGYNIVGDGTPQALIPILTGRTETELPNTRRGDAGAVHCNAYPFLWNDTAWAGYATLFAEDAPSMHAFNLRLKGFDSAPTDHYMRTFFLDQHSAGGRAWVRHGDGRSQFQALCLGTEPLHKAFLRYPADFHLNYRPQRRPVFSFAHHAGLSHDDVHWNRVGLMDSDLRAHLTLLSDSGVLNDTLLLLFSDHGARYAALRSTHQGQLEERLPFVSISAPAWWREQNEVAWSNLLTNQKRLTSPFDLHPTFKDLLQWEKRGGTEGPPGKPHRGRSLWGEVPAERTCPQADIAPHWCTCQRWEAVAAESELGGAVAAAVVAAVNAETAPVRRLCRRLSLARVLQVRRSVPNADLLRYKGASDAHGFKADLSANVSIAFADFQVTLETVPGHGRFEATLGYHMASGQASLDIYTAMSRINAYGDQPRCIQGRAHTKLVSFCVCPDDV